MKNKNSTNAAKIFMLAVSGTLALTATGCGKKTTVVEITKPAADATDASASIAPATKPPAVLNAVVVPEAAAGNPQVLDALTQALRKYAVEHKAMPQNFSEIVNAGYVANLPPPPPGKKFAVDARTATVILVNQ